MKTLKTILRLILTLFLITGCNLSTDKEINANDSFCKSKYMDKGKSVGRNAMIVYISETNQVDTLKIEITRLLAIEDSLSVKILK